MDEIIQRLYRDMGELEETIKRVEKLRRNDVAGTCDNIISNVIDLLTSIKPTEAPIGKNLKN